MEKKNIRTTPAETAKPEEVLKQDVGGEPAGDPIAAGVGVEPAAEGPSESDLEPEPMSIPGAAPEQDPEPESFPEPRSEYPPEPTYSKRQLMEASRYAPAQKDVLSAILTDYEQYTLGKVDRMIADFEQRTVD